MARRAVIFSGALLVGGASRRFGSAKALASFEGRTLAERAWQVLGEICEDRVALGKAGDGLTLPFPVLDDGIDVRAPIAGVAAALRAARNDVCVVLPVDCPLVTADLLARLAAACSENVAVAVSQEGPLPGAYRLSALPVLDRALLEGRLRLRDALEELEVVVVDVDPGLLANINTAADLRGLYN